MPNSEWNLNQRAYKLASTLATPDRNDDLQIGFHVIEGDGWAIDFGAQTPGNRAAGLVLARICTAGLAEISLASGTLSGAAWPHVHVSTEAPVAACLLSQYAGWALKAEKYFAMGSGPMRAAYGKEEIFRELDYKESPAEIVGVLEARKLPTPAVYQMISEKTGVERINIWLLVAPAASPAGNLQIVARVVETALHKLHALHFDLSRIVAARGSAPLSPVGPDELTAMGWSNDAILYGGSVTLDVRGDDESLAEIGPRVPACSTACYGQPFLEIFEAAGRDFYKIDANLFSPGEIEFRNLDTGRTHRFGRPGHDVLARSYRTAWHTVAGT